MGASVVQPATRAHGNFVEGQNIHLVVEGRLRRSRIVVLVEEASDEKLVLNVPEADQVMLGLESGTKVELSYGFRIARMHFVCTSKIVAVDGNLLTLTRPAKAKKQPRRGFARVGYQWPVIMKCTDGAVLTGRTRNVSASGALIRLDSPIQGGAEGEDLHSIVLKGSDERDYITQCRIVRSSRERNFMFVAVHFDALPEVERVHLELAVLRGIARRFLRVEMRLQCKVELGGVGGKVSFEGTTDNISGGGVLLHCGGGCELTTGMRGSITFDLEGRALTLNNVIVLRVLEPDENGSRLIIEFSEIRYATRVSLVEFLMKKLGESRSV